MKFYLGAFGLGLVFIVLAYDYSARVTLTKQLDAEHASYERLRTEVGAIHVQLESLVADPTKIPDDIALSGHTIVFANMIGPTAPSAGAPVVQAPPARSVALPAPPPPPPQGFLNINSIPPSTCILDGNYLGATPRVKLSVKPGTHTVQFVNADQGVSKTISVAVAAGETKQAVARLDRSVDGL